MAMDQGLEDLEAFLRRLESDPESVDVRALVDLIRAFYQWMVTSSIRLRMLEERMAELEGARYRMEERLAQLEAEFEEMRRRHEERLASLQALILQQLGWALARGGGSLFSSN
ncbi:MAG: hypothetical protein RQ891_00535 [Thermoflexus sp.]|jgi:predicted nuclease with TOPRIM domain